MYNAFMDSHFFAIPVRLVWDDFEEFMGETKTYKNKEIYAQGTSDDELTFGY